MWFLTRNKKEPELANDFEVYRYYDLKIRLKGSIYVYELPRQYYNGVLKNEFQLKIDKYLMLDEKSKNKIKLKAKNRLPYLEKEFKQITSKYNEKK
jgi:hypothetical protein